MNAALLDFLESTVRNVGLPQIPLDTEFRRAQRRAGMELRCPSCGSLLYSHKSRMCGQCGAVLPSEMVLTDAQAQAHEQERQWARNLADKFDTTGRATKADPGKSKLSSSESAEPDLSALEATLR